jgi:predicted dehydrogenase
MLVYALLPRLLLGWLSRHLYRRRLQRTFIGYPGADLILRRMKQPLIQSQGAAGSEPRPGSHGELLEEFRLPDDGVLVVSWAGALGEGDLDRYRELSGADPAILMQAGTSLEADREAIDRARQEDSQLLILVVKAWEPPMSDLADFIAEIARGGSSVLFLQPLRDTGIPEDRLDDWRRFADELPGGAQVVAMSRLPAGARPAEGGSNGAP